MKTKKNLNRRDFIGMTVAGSSALFAQSCRDWSTEVRTVTQQKVRVRYDINSTEAAAQRNIEYFKKAVAKMKALPRSNPASWIAQAEIHRKYCSGNLNIHRKGLFPPWHRAYLFFFEEICRQLLMKDKVADYADFALPYWDWTTSPQVPAAFGETVWDADLNTIKPPDDWITAPNIKWERLIQPKGRISGDLQLDDIANTTSFFAIIGSDPIGEFTGRLETGPHATIHNEIGGNMSDSALAALDPIFWLHHANIDRLWSKWMENCPDKTPSPNCQPEGCRDDCKYPPVITEWLKKTVEGFYDVNGTPISRQVINLLDTFNLQYLGYRYNDGKPTQWSECPVIYPINVPFYSIKSEVVDEAAKVNESKTVRVGNFLASTSENLKTLENLNASIAQMFQLKIDSQSCLSSPSLLLSIKVEKPVNPAISVRVFLNAPSDPTTLSIDSPSYVATFSFFESPKEAHHHDNLNMNSESRGFIFDITNTIIKLYNLNDSKPFTLEDVTISIFPRLINADSSDETEKIKLISFKFDLAK